MPLKKEGQAELSNSCSNKLGVEAGEDRADLCLVSAGRGRQYECMTFIHLLLDPVEPLRVFT